MTDAWLTAAFAPAVTTLPSDLVWPLVTALPSDFVRPLSRIVGIALFAGTLALTVGVVYRLYARERVPDGIALLVAIGVVGISLNTSVVLGEVLVGDRDVFALATVVENVLAFGLSGAVGPAAARLGDRLANTVTAAAGAREVDGEVSRLVKAVGRVLTVTLPDEIEDIEAYDPVRPETKAELAGTTLVFPRRLTVAELRDRVVERLKTDYGVGHVDVDLAADGSVEYLAVGSRAAGLGPTLPPGTVAVAVRADPAFSAGVGDRVQVYEPGDPPERVVTAELRGTAGDVVTLAVDESEAGRLDETTRYRLATLPATPRVENEFASLLRAADETMGVVTVGAGAELDGTRVGDVDGAVVAVRPEGEAVEPLPERDRALAAGDVVYVVGRPEAIRRLEAAARAAVDEGAAT